MILFATMRVRNEADIIESVCRHALSYCDGILLYDNYSFDDTRAILNAMISEGLNIHLADDFKERKILDLDIATELARVSFEKYGADWVIGLDADEFLFTADGSDIRQCIEALEPMAEHWVRWRTYVLTEEPENNEVFLPDFFPTYRNDELDIFYKTIVSARLFGSYPCRMTAGRHSIRYLRRLSRPVPLVKHDILRMAHYPIRSRQQAFLKIVLNEITQIFICSNRVRAFHYTGAYRSLEENGFPTLEHARQVSSEFALTKEQIDRALPHEVGCFSHPPIVLKYTDYSSSQKYFYQIFLSQLRQTVEQKVMELQQPIWDANRILQARHNARDWRDNKRERLENLLSGTKRQIVERLLAKGAQYVNRRRKP